MPASSPVVRLVLPVNGQLSPWTAGSTWRAVVPTEHGDVAPEQALSTHKASPLMSRGDRSLLAAMSDPGIEQIDHLVQSGGDAQLPAAVVLALRAAEVAPARAEAALELVLGSGQEPWGHKALRRFLPDVLVCVVLAPGVRAVLSMDANALGLLRADVLNAGARALSAVSVLEALPMSGVVGVALAAAYLTTGRSNAVVTLTEQLNNIDDFSALDFVARAVALRTLGHNKDALEALDRALAWPDRHPGVMSAALEERAAMLGQVGETLAARSR